MEKTPMRMVLVPLAILATAAPLRGFQVDSDLRQRIDEVFSEYDRTNGPGCAVGLVQAGRLAYARGYGIGQMDHTVPLDETSVFYLASVSKQFTAAAVLIAEHEGYLALDDDIRTHIPEFPDYGAPVTVRHLLHHTGGVRDYLTLMSLAGIPYENVLTDESMLGLIARQRELNFEPGSEHLYSNSGYVLLAEIVKRATGRSLREYAHQKIFQPLAMTNTHFHDDRTRIVKNRVFSYDPGPDGSWRTNYLMNFDKVGDGGLYSSVEDLARWDAAFYADLLGVPDFASRMYTRGVLSTGDTIAYARGLGVGERRGLRRVAHGGGLMAFRTMIARYPDERTTVITLCNVGSASSGRLSAAVEDAVLADRFPEPVPDQEAGRQSAREEAEEGPPIEVSDSVLALLAGEYYSPELETTWVLEVRDLGLVLHHPSGTKLALEARSDEVFEARGLELEFLSEGGEVTGFVLGAGRVRNIRFARSPG
jgi:CubicO group peptidase (beta-lactamase class C family)